MENYATNLVLCMILSSIIFVLSLIEANSTIELELLVSGILY